MRLTSQRDRTLLPGAKRLMRNREDGEQGSGCWRDGQSGRSFGATVQSRRALGTRRRLVASDPLGAAPTQRAALHFSRRRDAGGEVATRRDAGQALPPGGRDQQPGPGQRAKTRQRAPDPKPATALYGENEERSENGAGTGNATIRRRVTGSGVAASKWGPADAGRAWAQIFRAGVKSNGFPPRRLAF